MVALSFLAFSDGGGWFFHWLWWIAFPSVFWPICQLEVWSPVLPFVFQSFSFVFQFIFEWGTWFEREH